MNAPVPEALRAIIAEESHWQAVYFNDFSPPKQTLVVEKHGDNNYTFAKAEGTDVNLLQQLDELERQEVPAETALELRSKFDQNWASRGKFYESADSLWTRGMLSELGSGALAATVNLEGVTAQASEMTITIGLDGAISTQLDDPIMADEIGGSLFRMDWHEYELPRHTPYVVHRVKHKQKPLPIEKFVYDGLVIVRKQLEWFKLAEAIARG